MGSPNAQTRIVQRTIPTFYSWHRALKRTVRGMVPTFCYFSEPFEERPPTLFFILFFKHDRASDITSYCRVCSPNAPTRIVQGTIPTFYSWHQAQQRTIRGMVPTFILFFMLVLGLHPIFCCRVCSPNAPISACSGNRPYIIILLQRYRPSWHYISILSQRKNEKIKKKE